MKKIVYLIIYFLITSCNSQNINIEKKLLNCYQNEKFETSILQIEQKFIEKNILKNSNGKSYLKLLKDIKNNRIINVPKFENELIKINNKTINCQKKIINSPEYKQSKVYKLKKVFETNKNSRYLGNKIVDDLLNILNPNDFKKPYYKLLVFRLIEIRNTNSELGIFENIPEKNIKLKNKKYNKILEIYLNERSEIIVNKLKISETELKKIIYEFEKKNKKNSFLSIIPSRNTKYKTYTTTIEIIENEINKLRNEYSIKEYQKEFDKLKIKEKNIVKIIYPKNITEKEPK